MTARDSGPLEPASGARPGRFRRVALWCWYDGAQFWGYQRQQGVRTVQAELLRAFSAARLARNPVVAGRTDRGVSARMQVLSARVEQDLGLGELVARLNAHLPADLGIHLAREAKSGFHAAWSACSKEYRYRLGPDDVPDRALLEQAAALIPGTRDFRVFHFKSSQLRPRTVRAVEVSDEPDGLTLRFVGEAFARYMVRMLVGALIAVCRKEISLDTFRQGLLAQQNFHCPTAPAQALTLWEVGYPDALDPFSPADRRDFAWPALASARTPQTEVAASAQSALGPKPADRREP